MDATLGTAVILMTVGLVGIFYCWRAGAFTRKLKRAIQDCKEGKTIPFKRRDFFAYYRAERKWEKAHPYLALAKHVYRRVRSFIYDIPDLPRDGYRKVRRGIERGCRGWAHEDTWNLEHYLSRVMYQSVEHLFKYNKSSFRTQVSKNPENDYDAKKSREIKKKILYALKLRLAISNGDREGYYPQLSEKERKKCKCLTKEEERRRLEGMALLDHYWGSLWD
jgi:hypothetical protein